MRGVGPAVAPQTGRRRGTELGLTREHLDPSTEDGTMLKFLGGTIGVIFLIGLLVVIGILALIF